jgi:hypothetical protein
VSFSEGNIEAVPQDGKQNMILEEIQALRAAYLKNGGNDPLL